MKTLPAPHPFTAALKPLLLGALALALGALNARAQQQKTSPHIGYLFPAGAQRGTACEIAVGGQFLDDTKELLVYGGAGVKGTVVKIEKPLPQKRLAELRDYLAEARKKYQETGQRPIDWKRFDKTERVALILKEAGATDDEIKGFLQERKNRMDPKRQQNQQIAETVIAKIDVAPDAPLGPRELRVWTARGISNPLAFCIGGLPEQRKPVAQDDTPQPPTQVTLPAVLNGQILPGEVHHFAFQARRGAQLVVAVQARDLIPYLADAVPGWFQPVTALYDAKGKEVAFAKDFRFTPDPVFCYNVPQDGAYVLEIRDAVYRGREDFVYRITVGEVPFVTGIFPLGGRVGLPAVVSVSGWNLPHKKIVLNPAPTEGVRTAPEMSNGRVIADTPFSTDALPQVNEEEPNNHIKQAQRLRVPVIVNGRIDAPGDVDVYGFYCAAGASMVAEIQARRLNSPLDSWLKITDATGRQLAFNDDWEDLGAGLLTHKADSYLTFTAPASGTYYAHVGDSQHKGGPEYGYRLRISPPRPDFALRITPSAINGRTGFSMPVTVYALRKDGFDGDITLALKDAPPGFSLDGGVIQQGQDKVRATITLPGQPGAAPVNLAVEGSAMIGGQPIIHTAVPAEDMLQAFAYHHLVPAGALVAIASGVGRNKPLVNINDSAPVQLPVGGVGRRMLAAPKGGQGRTVQFELSEPPEGITIEGVAPAAEGMEVSFRADSKVKPGLSGNLILEAFTEQTPPPKDGKPQPKRRFSVGYLPAIPFKTIAP